MITQTSRRLWTPRRERRFRRFSEDVCTLALDEETCVVFGVPREAIRLGPAQDIAPLQDISAGIMTILQTRGQKASRLSVWADKAARLSAVVMQTASHSAS